MICISATFTAEPIQPVLDFWARQLGADWQAAFAPFNQVHQTLLDPTSLFALNRSGANVVLVRSGEVEELLAMLEQAQFSVPTLLAVCPPAELQVAVPPGIFVVDTSAYPVEHWYDAEADRLGSIPYTAAYFTALGTAIARLVHALERPPFKLISLDCDHTLWDGVCGEDGPTGVVPRQELQQFLLAQRDAGMLLALSSKNNPDDVWETFDAHPEMLLKREHITSHRLSWEPKSAGLRQMAAELSLGADSFMLLDDNSKEIAELAEGAPEVLGLTLPADGIPHYLNHVWAFDHPVVTAADRDRAAGYEQQKQFAAAANLEHFYETLNLQVHIEPLSPADLPRAAQLTQRTNQFNFTTIRRTEAEIAPLTAFSIRVADRFGDYGLTGLLIVDGAELDTFLLSCRVLGRGVEHAVVRWLGEHYPGLTLRFTPTAKNAPAQTFYRELAGADLCAVTFTTAAPAEPVAAPPAQFRDYQRIATELSTVEQIQAAILAEQLAAAPAREVKTLPATATEQQLAAIWADLLGQPAIGADDNFFDLGGHSLLAVLLVTRVHDAFGVELSMDDVYSSDTTLSKLARLIETHELTTLDPAEQAALLAEIEALSDDEVRALLAT